MKSAAAENLVPIIISLASPPRTLSTLSHYEEYLNLIRPQIEESYFPSYLSLLFNIK